MAESSTESIARPRSGPRSGGERRNVRGEATRRRILTAAERIFAEHGVAAAPLRDIGIAAGQRNHAAVQYHFGDRDELVRALMEYRGDESEASRADLVAQLMLDDGRPTVPDVLNAFIWPLAIHLQENNHYLAFLSRLVVEEGGYEGLGRVHVHAGASVLALRTLLSRLVPDVPDEVLDERWQVALTSAVQTLARYQSAQQKREHLPVKLEVLIADLIAFLSAGIVAPIASGDPRSSRRPAEPGAWDVSRQEGTVVPPLRPSAGE
ncbi:TetR/AcrR family transcriptional regulator [Microbacterium sp.]|uniref:TetR/AcrR family transcriptional regulator n=1 Tax=Microbacterium sp. TaxID=51671 RepID=UPI0039E2EB2C